MSGRLLASIALLSCVFAVASEAGVHFSGERRLNNLASELLAVSSISKPSESFEFVRSSAGWIFVSSTFNGTGTARLILDQESDAMIIHEAESGLGREAMRFVAKGDHTIQVELTGAKSVEKLSVKAIPELIHCGLGFNPEIKGSNSNAVVYFA